jgi:hypothetical protein
MLPSREAGPEVTRLARGLHYLEALALLAKLGWVEEDVR